MDQDTKDYLEKRLLGLAFRDDVEKLRQELKVNFKQLREEEKTNLNAWREEFKKEFERFEKENKNGVGPIQEMINQDFERIRKEIQNFIEKFNLLKEDIKSMMDHSIKEIGASLQLKEGVENFKEGIKPLLDEMALLREKMKEGFVETREELGSMMKFSYADLEKRLNALEARIKALEKMVFP